MKLTAAAFARHASVSKAAVSKAIRRGRVFLGPDSLIDTDAAVNAAYLDHGHVHQRLDHLKKRRRSIERKPTEAELLEAWATRGELPSGWAAICLADVPDAQGRRLPLMFEGPSGRQEEEIETAAVRNGTYRLDFDRDVAVDREGKVHALHFEVFGEPDYLRASEIAPA